MIKKVFLYAMIFTLFFASISVSAVYGNAQAELDKIREEQSNLQSELNKGKNMVSNLNKEIKNLESNIAALNLEISELSTGIVLTEEKIGTALIELDKVEGEIAEQQEALGNRLAAMYMNGDIGFMDVLLGSGSISELMSNIDRVQMVYETDKEMLETLNTQRLVIEAQREYLAGLQTQLEKEKVMEAEKKKQIEEDKALVADKKSEVEADNEALSEQIDALNAEANALVAEILKLQGKGDYIGGEFTWPAPGVKRISSPFGYRLHPILKYNKLHTGMDIATPSNTTIVASNAGTVIKAAWNNSYGYMVMVDHGGGIVTLYAHNNSLLVKTGDVVYKGQAIAKSGSTGMSTGPHLHFEVRVNGEYVDPKDYITYGK